MQAVSILILTRNRLGKLTTCLDRLQPQLHARDEVVVIDTGSDDGTVTAMETEAPPLVRFFRFDGPGSWAEARNFGLDHASNPLIAFIDDDCYAAEDWIERGRTALADRDAVGGWVEPHEIEDWPPWWDPQMGWLVGISVPGHSGPDAGRYFYPYTSNVWVRADVARAEKFQEIGGEFGAVEEQRYQTGREDAEWWRRLRVRGYRATFDPLLRVEHHIESDRLNEAYVSQRARRDGQAWATREGTEEDLGLLAYQWWAHWAPDEGEELRELEEAQWQGRQRFHRLMRERNMSALKALSEKLCADRGADASPALMWIRALMHSGFDFVWHRSKTMGRRLTLSFSPPPNQSRPESAPKKIAIMAFAFVGDLVILSSALKGVLDRNPDLQVSLLAPPAAEAIFASNDRVELTALPETNPDLATARTFLRDWLAQASPEAILAPYLHGPWGPALARLKSLAAPVVGFDCDEGLERQIDRERLPLRVEKDLTLHETRNLERLFSFVRLEGEPQKPEIRPDSESARWAKDWRDDLPDGARGLPLLMLNPHAAKQDKEWTAGAWRETIGKLLEELPHAFVINLSRPDPQLTHEVERAFGENPRVQWLRGQSLARLIAMLSICEGIVTVDAAPQHLAHALGVPSLTLFGPMDERRWADAWARPIHPTLRGGSFDLTPEELRGLPHNHLMRLIVPEALLGAVRDWKRHLSGVR